MLLALWWVNLLGLVLSIVGSSLLFFGSPRDTADVPQGEMSSLDKYMWHQEHDLQKEFDKLNQRTRKSKWGFGLIWFGFILQIIPQFFQIPHR